MLNINDLNVSKKLDSKEMTEVRGGFDPFAILDSSTSIKSAVADVTQAFGFEIAQGNTGSVVNTQVITAGNGVTFAPVYQKQSQSNNLNISDIGGISVG